MAWEYEIDDARITDRMSGKKQAEEVANFKARLNERGKQGWEMISFETIPLTGSISGNVKGYTYLVFWKRPA